MNLEVSPAMLDIAAANSKTIQHSARSGRVYVVFAIAKSFESEGEDWLDSWHARERRHPCLPTLRYLLSRFNDNLIKLVGQESLLSRRVNQLMCGAARPQRRQPFLISLKTTTKLARGVLTLRTRKETQGIAEFSEVHLRSIRISL